MLILLLKIGKLIISLFKKCISKLIQTDVNWSALFILNSEIQHQKEMFLSNFDWKCYLVMLKYSYISSVSNNYWVTL